MGLFDFKKKKEILLGAPVEGECVPLSQVSDPTFRDEILGKGVAFQALGGKVFAPADGEVSTVFPTGHAVVLTTSEGVEILIHIGLDTVKLEGKHFQIKTEAGKQVKKGELLIEADIQAIEKEGYDCMTPMIICNTPDFTAVEGIAQGHVKPGDDCLRIRK